MMAGFGRCDEIAYSLISSLILSLATVSSRLSLDVVAHASKGYVPLHVELSAGGIA